jgi:hypothetical protein
LISLDFRPEFGGNGYYNNNYGSDVALGLSTNSNIKLFTKNATRIVAFLSIIISFELILTTQNGGNTLVTMVSDEELSLTFIIIFYQFQPHFRLL